MHAAILALTAWGSRLARQDRLRHRTVVPSMRTFAVLVALVALAATASAQALVPQSAPRRLGHLRPAGPFGRRET